MKTTEMLNADLRKALIGYKFKYLNHEYTISNASEVSVQDLSVDKLSGVGQYAGLVRADEHVNDNITGSHIFEIYGTYKYENFVFVKAESINVKSKYN